MRSIEDRARGCALPGTRNPSPARPAKARLATSPVHAEHGFAMTGEVKGGTLRSLRGLGGLAHGLEDVAHHFVHEALVVAFAP